MGEIISKRFVMFLIATLLFVIVMIGTVSATDWTVNPGQSIQSVIDYANDTDNILVNDNGDSNATYNENILINRNISVKANGTVIIQASNPNAPVVTINSNGNGSTLQGFIITGATNSDGILLNNTQGCTISNNTITNNSVGINLLTCESNDISNNTFSNNCMDISACPVSIYVRTYSYDGTYTGWTYHNTPVFCVDVQNNGPNDATGVEVQYILGDGLTLQNFSTRGYGTATYDPLTRTITWLIGTIPNGGRVYMDLTTQIIKTGTTNVTAILTKVDQNNTDTQHQQKTRTITIVPSADIQVTQNINPNPNYDNSVIITITAQNNGPNNATGVSILDQLPSGLTLQSYSIQGKGTYNPLTGLWTIGNLTNGENSILTLIATVTQTGTITNTAQRNGTTQSEWNQQDWNINNNAQTVNLIIPASADIQINQNSSNYAPNYLEDIILTIITKNNGPNTATGVQTKIVLPEGLQYISHTVTNGTYDPLTGIWNIGNLNNQESAVLTIVAKVLQACIIENTATKAAEVQYDPIITNNAQTVTLNVPEAAYVEVNKTATPTNPKYKDTVTYTITATNKGPDDATGVNINYSLPSGITLIGSSATRGSYSNGVWNIGNLANGETVTLTITALINTTGTITDNSLTVTQNQYVWNHTLPGPVNWNIPQSADIQVTQTVSNSSPTVDTNVNFSVNVKNNGPNNASGVTVTTKLPTGLSLVNWKVSRDGGLNWVANDSSYNSNTGLWTIGALNNGITYILNLTATATQMGNFTNNANKTAETQYDWNSTNNAQNASVSVVGSIPKDIFTDQGTTSGTVNSDDGTTTAITLPFTITLYGQTYNTIYISVNGAIGLGNPIQGPYYYQLPESSTLNQYVAYIAPFWADFDVAHIGSVTYTITNNQINITWYRVPNHSDNRDSNNVNTVTLIITNASTYGFIYGDLDWKNDPSDSYPSYARISKGDNGATYKNFWTGDQELSEIANKSFWFDSNGNLISGAADIAVTQSAGASTIHLYWGSNTTTLTITVTNNGPNTATGVEIKEVLNSHISYKSHTVSYGTSYNSSTGIWNIGTLASGESKILVITVGANSYGSGASTATKLAETQYDPVSTNNDASATINVNWY